MKRTLRLCLAVSAGFAAAGLLAVPTASAYPVGPWGVQGPCPGRPPAGCPMSPSPDGLTWAWHGDAWNYDKTGGFVCMSSQLWCEPVMAMVRAAPPAPVGAWLHPS